MPIAASLMMTDVNLALDLTPQIAGAPVAVPEATAAIRGSSHPSYATALPCFPSSCLDRWLISLSFCDNLSLL